MGNTQAAVLAMVLISAMGFCLAEGEKQRVGWLRAMRRCLLRMKDMIRYERRDVTGLLAAIELDATRQERQLCGILHACAREAAQREGASPASCFAAARARSAPYGVLGAQDRAAFEETIAQLGRFGMQEQLLLIDEAIMRLSAREQTLGDELRTRCRLLRTLCVSGGAAMFLLLI